MKAAIISVSIIIALLGLAFAYYYIFLNPQQPQVGLQFSKPMQVFVGEPFDLTVSYSNYSNQILKGAILSLALPDGISFIGQPTDQRVMEQAVGDLGPGSINQEDFHLIALNGAQSLKHFDAKLIYTISTSSYSSTQLQTQAGLDLPIGQPAVNLSLNAPQSIFSGESFSAVINYQNNSDTDFQNLQLRVDYPSFFQFQSASQKPATGNNVWDLGKLAKGTNGTLTITGDVVAPAQSFFSIGSTVSSNFSNQSYDLNSQTASIMISPSPLSLGLSLNGISNYTAHLGDNLTYVLDYKNNSDTPLQNVVLKATLLGRLFDFSTVNSDASFDPLSSTFTWFAANTPGLADLSPGQEGSVTLNIKVKNGFPIYRLSDKDYSLKMNAEIESPTVPPNIAAQRIISLVQMETEVAGQISIVAGAYWRDAASGILNLGPYPPKVNQPTQYTVHWKIINYATDVSNVQVIADLLSSARWTGVVRSNVDTQPSYDPSSGKVTWNINNVAATAGIVASAPEAIFQLEVTPPITSLNGNVTFLSAAQIQAQDDFTSSTLTASAPALDTSLPADQTITVSDRTVKQ